ncbi:hypothetical protein CEXT_406551 [Caerostris extrusa]|uniref:Uncharacterized protein n=1 Tax=Caerostris extrusa TaxID=172846 RepID=A0AAV4Q783_CAEEX|nr:hypothetical protein CEXT_406551 [Caerostris extrusa]
MIPNLSFIKQLAPFLPQSFINERIELLGIRITGIFDSFTDGALPLFFQKANTHTKDRCQRQFPESGSQFPSNSLTTHDDRFISCSHSFSYQQLITRTESLPLSCRYRTLCKCRRLAQCLILFWLHSRCNVLIPTAPCTLEVNISALLLLLNKLMLPTALPSLSPYHRLSLSLEKTAAPFNCRNSLL